MTDLKKSIMFLLLFTAGIGALLSGCGSKASSGESWYYYHLDEEGTALEKDTCDLSEVSQSFTVEISDTDSSAAADASAEASRQETAETAGALIAVLNAADSEALFPEGVEITACTLNAANLTLDFSQSYYEMDAVRELLCRAAVVETLLQIDAVSSVTFTVAGEALTDDEGTQIGRMTEDTFIANPVSQINSTQKATVVLYFTDSAGEYLYPEQRTLHYFTSMSAEWMVVEQLIKGPEEDTLSATIPAETSILNVTTADGICYVNLDQTFLSTTFTVSAQTAIYSIVNSLCELDGVDSVQITIEGSSDVIYQDAVSLNQSFTMNEALIADDADPIETEVTTEDE